MKADILIKNGRVVTHSGIFEADVAVHGEKIAGLFAPDSTGDAEQIIDAKGLLVFPGLFDSHVHFNEPGREDWEGFETGSKSVGHRWRESGSGRIRLSLRSKPDNHLLDRLSQ